MTLIDSPGANSQLSANRCTYCMPAEGVPMALF
jgi:hypothetical protein